MLKQVIIVRTDAGMGKGKMCGQAGHAAIAAYARSKHICHLSLTPNEFDYSGEIKEISDQCEAGQKSFTNDAVSTLLIKLGRMVFNNMIDRIAATEDPILTEEVLANLTLTQDDSHKDCPHYKADSWLANIQTKVVLKVGSEDELKVLLQKAINAGIVAAPIYDAGRTQIEAGTFTCIGLGPDEAEKLDAVTGDLKLL